MQSSGARPADAELAGTSCILIFEFDILLRQPLAAYLRECGYRVCEALSVDEAILLLTAKELSIDMVLAARKGDQPNDAGFALAGWMRAHRPDVEIIITGTIDQAAEAAQDLCEDGPALSKPADHAQLLETIRRSLAARERSRN
jgi:DNA-binding NtrC family response regulator